MTESLWDTVKNPTLNIILREPALLELARRKEPGVISFCDTLLLSEDQECWFSALKALELLNTYDAAQRLLTLCGASGTGDRRIVLGILARILPASHKEGFRRLLRSVIAPGEINVSGWSPIALRVLANVCAEIGIQISNPLSQITDLETTPLQFGTQKHN